MLSGPAGGWMSLQHFPKTQDGTGMGYGCGDLPGQRRQQDHLVAKSSRAHGLRSPTHPPILHAAGRGCRDSRATELDWREGGGLGVRDKQDSQGIRHQTGSLCVDTGSWREATAPR